MSETSQGEGWWQASDGKWYPPTSVPGDAAWGQGTSEGGDSGGGHGAAPASGWHGSSPGSGAPSSGGYGSAPSSGGYGSAPSSGGYGSAPSSGGYGSAPSSGGYGSAPSAEPMGGSGAPSSGGYGAPSTSGYGAPPGYSSYPSGPGYPPGGYQAGGYGVGAYGGYPMTQKNNGLAVAALVCGVLPLCILPILGIIFGFVSRSQIRRSGGREKGEGMAMAGIIVGFIWTALTVIYVIVVLSKNPHCVNNGSGGCTIVTN